MRICLLKQDYDMWIRFVHEIGVGRKIAKVHIFMDISHELERTSKKAPRLEVRILYLLEKYSGSYLINKRDIFLFSHSYHCYPCVSV